LPGPGAPRQARGRERRGRAARGRGLRGAGAPGVASRRALLYLRQLVTATAAAAGGAARSAAPGPTSPLMRPARRNISRYAVDAGDRDVRGLFHYTRLGAEQTLRAPVALPAFPPAAAAGPEALRDFCRRFSAALFAALPPATVVVFDDYHEAAGEPEWNEV